jgi:hypothetical protein
MRGLKLCDVVKTFIILLLPSFLHAAGRVDADFLRVEPSARTSGMSGSFCSVADDLSAVIFNPAGLVQLKHTSLSFTHFSSFADTCYEYIGGGMPFGKGAAALSVQCGYTLDFDEIDEFGDKIGTVPNFDFVLTGSYGFFVLPQVSLGANIKGFYSKLYLYQKVGFAADAGVFVMLAQNPYTRAGAVLQNVGAQSAYISISDPLPTNIKAGISTKIKIQGIGNLLISTDVNRLLGKDELPTLDFGLEAEIYDVMIIRAGYGFRHDMANVSVGLGVLLQKVRFSYSYVPFDVLGAAHRLTLDIEL